MLEEYLMNKKQNRKLIRIFYDSESVSVKTSEKLGDKELADENSICEVESEFSSIYIDSSTLNDGGKVKPEKCEAKACDIAEDSCVRPKTPCNQQTVSKREVNELSLQVNSNNPERSRCIQKQRRKKREHLRLYLSSPDSSASERQLKFPNSTSYPLVSDTLIPQRRASETSSGFGPSSGLYTSDETSSAFSTPIISEDDVFSDEDDASVISQNRKVSTSSRRSSCASSVDIKLRPLRNKPTSSVEDISRNTSRRGSCASSIDINLQPFRNQPTSSENSRSTSRRDSCASSIDINLQHFGNNRAASGCVSPSSNSSSSNSRKGSRRNSVISEIYTSVKSDVIKCPITSTTKTQIPELILEKSVLEREQQFPELSVEGTQTVSKPSVSYSLPQKGNVRAAVTNSPGRLEERRTSKKRKAGSEWEDCLDRKFGSRSDTHQLSSSNNNSNNISQIHHG